MNILEKVLNNPTLNKAVQKGVEKTLDGLNKGIDSVRKKLKKENKNK
ncbi:hypothetical protein [Fusobacterium polymorphum]|nr:hypothetical protein [Fusobacterium polymorphum]